MYAVFCVQVTMTVSPKKAIDHPARDYTGHFNPCYGWDYKPASFIAVFGCAADVYLAWTYATYEQLRTHLRDYDGKIDRAERFSLLTTYLHGFASMLWMVLWQVGPPDDQWTAHLAIFSVSVYFRYLCTLGNYVEQRFGGCYDRTLVSWKNTVFIIVYGLVTTALPILYFVDVLVYKAEDRTGVDPVINRWLLQVMDIAWVSCLALTTKFAIPEPPLLIQRRVLEFGEEVEVDSASARPLKREQ